MARRYYDTSQRVFQLFNNHPALSQMYEEFGVETDGIKRVAEFLIMNHDKIEEYDLQDIYKTRTVDSFEPDQDSPVKGEVDSYSALPTTGIDQGDIWYITDPYPGRYFYWDGAYWKEDVDSIDKSRALYLEALYEEHGYKVWEEEYGTFVAVEGDDGKTSWEKMEVNDYDFTVIRVSDLPTNPNPGDVYNVLGEDLIDIISSLYGFVDMGMTIPWSQYVSAKQTNLQQLLNMTIYLYRYGVTDNFYENNIWQFIPEYDREQMYKEPKMKLFMESMGRKLDQLEDKLTRLEDVYDIDETPSDLLDHLGQMLGYEKEDFSLSDVSFRELLKNIIEIYKIKGTNYSFSFFFKFLGFNVNLKEFYFNKDVKNPEAFPGMDEDNVEFYLTTVNPIYETYWGKPAKGLAAIRSLDDWALEYKSLKEHGCENPENYMMGKEPHSKDGTTMHSNPWTYFKTNLIEYELNPFFDKVNLTSSDNETIMKYIKFLSPTYLFTWINVNLAPWIENVSVQENVYDTITAEIDKTFGDSKDGKYNDYEEVEDILQVWDDKANKLISYRKADEMGIDIVNNLNIGGDDQIGTALRHDGVYIRQPGHPSHITGVRHDGSTRLSFDNLDIKVKLVDDNTYDDIYEILDDLPSTELEDRIVFVEETKLYYIFKDPAPYWLLIDDYSTYFSDGKIVEVDDIYIYDSYKNLTAKNASVLEEGDIYYLSGIDKYYSYRAGDVDNWVLTDKADVILNIERIEFINDVSNPVKDDIFFITNENNYYRHNGSYWELILDPLEVSILVNTRHQYVGYSSLLSITPPVRDMIYKTSSTSRYYKYINEDAYWDQAYDTSDRYTNWLDYSYRPYPSYPINVRPSPGMKLLTNNLDFIWDDIFAQKGYWVQVSRDVDFNDIVLEEFIYNNDNFVKDIQLENNNFFWRIRTKNNLDIDTWSIEEIDKIYLIDDSIKDYFILTDVYTIKSDLTGSQLNMLIKILASTGNKFNWGQWSSIYRFETNGPVFPHDGQVINDITYQFLDSSYDKTNGAFLSYTVDLKWSTSYNIEEYEVIVSRAEDFSSVVNVINSSSNVETINVYNGTYYWKYKSKKYNKEYGEYSDINTFKIDI